MKGPLAKLGNRTLFDLSQSLKYDEQDEISDIQWREAQQNLSATKPFQNLFKSFANCAANFILNEIVVCDLPADFICHTKFLEKTFPQTHMLAERFTVV